MVGPAIAVRTSDATERGSRGPGMRTWRRQGPPGRDCARTRPARPVSITLVPSGQARVDWCSARLKPLEDPSCETHCENVLTPAPSAPAS